MKITEGQAVKYAELCVQPDNDKVPKYVKKQCEAWLEIVRGGDDEAYIDEQVYGVLCSLLKLIIHPDLSKPMYECAEPYAWLLITAVFCTRARSDNSWYYRTALLEICRKNFKTFYAGLIFILGMLIMGKFGRYFSVAPDLKLSKELQIAIKKIIKSSPALNDGTIFKLLRSEIRCLATDSEYTPLAYSNDKMDGKLANMFLADEAGAMDNYPIEAMRSSQVNMKNRLGIILSTQYPNDENALKDEIDIAKKTLDRVESFAKNRRYFALLFEPDDYLLVDDLWQTDDRVIYQSNPVAVTSRNLFEALCEKRTLAVLYENMRENFLCKHCNIRYKGLGVVGYVDILKVRECRRAEDLDFWRGRRVWLGLDLSLTDDNTSLAMVTFEGDCLYAKVWGFIPADRLEEKSQRENVNYRKLIRDGVCFACGDNVIDYGFVERFVLSIPQKYGVEVVQLGFDRYNALSTVQKLENAPEPIQCVEIKQHSSVLHRPTKLLKEKILTKKFAYDENELLEINFENARCTEDTNLNKYVNKKKSEGKVDCVVSLINAVFLAQLEMENPCWDAQVF
ncbi:MAG: terminase large subunit [Prevotella sp.]|nr:terminase large subunit [Prevotella sp.]